MEAILDFSKDLNVGLFDIVIVALYSGSGGEQQQQAQRVLSQFQEHSDAWTRVPMIMERSSYPQSKFVGLQILEKLINTRWKALPLDQRQGVRNFVINLNVQIASDEATARREKTYLNKLNMALVQILKQDWPQDWPTFMPELIQSSHNSLSLCENNMHILRLLSEEIFDYSSSQMTHDKIAKLKTQFANEFSEIFTLCTQVLKEATKPSLIKATLGTLLRFQNWLSVDYMFRSDVVDSLLDKYLEAPQFRNLTIKCLAEMASLDVPPTHTEHIMQVFYRVITALTRLIPPSTDIAAAYSESSTENQDFILSIALFLCNFLSRHLNLVETSQASGSQLLLQDFDPLKLAHGYLLKISRVDEREIFKICVEYWVSFVGPLYLQSRSTGGHEGGEMTATAPGSEAIAFIRLGVYADVLSELRLVVIENMAKPEEVLVVENEDGEMVREHVQETDTIALYHSMRQLLVYLTHLGVKETENILTEKLGRQIDGSEWSWNNLNRLCWAIGSISGTMDAEEETSFFILVIKSLLGLSEMKRGKDDKVVVASAIMYIVGQYPRFLRGHWRFLKTVIQKLFEFMHETHEGVQDMAVDTFMKIVQKCHRPLVIRQQGERQAFVLEILSMLQRVTADLSPAQVYTFYEAVGYIIVAHPNQAERERMIAKLMELPMAAWEMLAEASTDVTALLKTDTLQILTNVLRSYVSACTSLGEAFTLHLGTIYLDILKLYRALGDVIVDIMANEGDIAAKTPRVRYARTVKREILKLVQTYVKNVSVDLDTLGTHFIPPFLDVIVTDYQKNPPSTREAAVLEALEVVVTKLDTRIHPYVPAIFEGVFEPTLDMIKQDFVEYPEHRLNLFKLLSSLTTHCFHPLLKLSPSQYKAFMNSIVWSMKHTGRDVSETGLQLCTVLVNTFASMVDDSTFARPFFQQYYITLLQEVFYVLTDGGHQSGFREQAKLLALLIHLVETNRISGPLYDESMPFRSNAEFIRSYIANLLITAFPHTSKENITTFVANLSRYHETRDYSDFKVALRDFLIQLKEFAGEHSDLFLDEREAEIQRKLQAEREAAARVPGMLKPSQLADDDDQNGAFPTEIEL